MLPEESGAGADCFRTGKRSRRGGDVSAEDGDGGSQAIYKQRGAVAEFPNAWIKDKLKLRKFCLRGIVKAGIEAMWACLTYNVMQWMRLSWRKAITATVAA